MYQLRDYQQKSVDMVRESFRSGKNAPLLVLPTGGGKTICFSYIAYNAMKKGSRVLILVHRQELIYQTSEKLTAWGVDHGIISPEFEHTGNGVQIAMIQTLTRRLFKTEKPDLLICDEAHHGNAANYKKVFEWAGCKIIGVTATPCRLDGRGLGEVFDDICLGVSTSELIERGFLSPYKYYALPVPKDLKDDLRKKMGEYTLEKTQKIAENMIPNIVGEWEEKSGKQPTIVFCPSVESANTVCRFFNDAGYRFEAISGEMKREDRKRIIQELADGTINGVTSCDVISEGTDIPVAGCAVLLRKTASTSLYLQQVGRVLRPVEGKTAIIIDMVQNYEEHGTPSDVREWSLDGKIKKPVDNSCLCPECDALNNKTSKYCTSCNAILRYKECKKCMGMVPSFEKECNHCGESFEAPKKEFVQNGSYTLAEITQFSPKHKKIFQKPFGEFLESKGWKKGAAFYKMKVLEVLGTSPEKAAAESWDKAHKEHGGDKYDLLSFKSYHKKLFREFDEWQKSAKA